MTDDVHAWPPSQQRQRADAPASSGLMVDGDLVLRPVVRDDAADILRAVRSSLDHLRPWMQWAIGDVDRDDVDHFIDQVEAGSEHSFAIRERDGGRFLGTCALNHVDPHHRTANLGFWLRSGATGTGVATRAARMVLVHGLTTMGLERIEVIISVANGPSLRVARRLGLTAEGDRRSALRIGDERHDARAFVAFSDDLPRLVAEADTA